MPVHTPRHPHAIYQSTLKKTKLNGYIHDLLVETLDVIAENITSDHQNSFFSFFLETQNRSIWLGLVKGHECVILGKMY